jgi:dolichol-phosphate mannosyltransferase
MERRFISGEVNSLADTAIRPRIDDLTSSFQSYEKALLERVIGSTDSNDYMFQMEMTVRMKVMGSSVAKVLTSFVDRIYSESKLGGNGLVEYAKGVLNFLMKL